MSAKSPNALVEKLVASLALAFAFIVMASIISPAPSQAVDHDDAPHPPAQHHPSTDPHEGLISLGSLEGDEYHIFIYSTDLGPRYSVYNTLDGTELSVLITAERVAQWYPELPLPAIDFDTPDLQIMLAEPEHEILHH